MIGGIEWCAFRLRETSSRGLCFQSLPLILLRNMFDGGEIACSEVDSAAGIVGCVVDYETRETKTPETDFVKLSAVTIAPLVVERVPSNGQMSSCRAVLQELNSPNQRSAISRDSTRRISWKRRPRETALAARRAAATPTLFCAVTHSQLVYGTTDLRVDRDTATRGLRPRRSRTGRILVLPAPSLGPVGGEKRSSCGGGQGHVSHNAL